MTLHDQIEEDINLSTDITELRECVNKYVEALKLRKLHIDEHAMQSIFTKQPESHIDEYIRRMILSTLSFEDIKIYKSKLPYIQNELLKGTYLSEENADLIFNNKNATEIENLAYGILLSLL